HLALVAQLHGHVQLSCIDQASEVSFHFAVRFVVIVEVAVDVALVKVGRVGDGLTRGRHQFVCCGSHRKTSRELSEDGAIRLSQFEQYIPQFRFAASHKCASQFGGGRWSLSDWDCCLSLASGHGFDSLGASALSCDSLKTAGW